MEQYISKDTLVAEIERRINELSQLEKASYEVGLSDAYKIILSFLNTLEVKEVYECNDVDLNPLFEEMGVEPDSRIALMCKNAFYKGVDNYLDK